MTVERDAQYVADVAAARDRARAHLDALSKRYGTPARAEAPAAQRERAVYNRVVPLTWAGRDFFAEYARELDAVVSATIGAEPRARAVSLLQTCLAPYYADAAAAEAVAAAVERSCYNTSITMSRHNFYPPHWDDGPFLHWYASRVGTVAENLDGDGVGSQYLGEALAAGRVQPDVVGRMSAYELCPDATRELRADLDHRSHKRVVPRSSRMYQCPRCKKRECTYQERQLARADEASSLVIGCLVCLHQWTI